eukprot:CAMPEP_0206557620 /NCGR_PEP_ID=MMETSP0325_2-20121206/19222_1 /ASSEMBLY_ACC=CAM_ASM_000347 /TAXON_ID=2866 /ORGANISM="Crypthecodinium cohnii, Strain Seligo" /LENGTH=52 /DNA_ID=CAMNT_0054058595 /DNA_START=105 /DNA_END=259 /DNA_ORIENTATION=-
MYDEVGDIVRNDRAEWNVRRFWTVTATAKRKERACSYMAMPRASWLQHLSLS